MDCWTLGARRAPFHRISRFTPLPATRGLLNFKIFVESRSAALHAHRVPRRCGTWRRRPAASWAACWRCCASARPTRRRRATRGCRPSRPGRPSAPSGAACSSCRRPLRPGCRTASGARPPGLLARHRPVLPSTDLCVRPGYRTASAARPPCLLAQHRPTGQAQASALAEHAFHREQSSLRGTWNRRLRAVCHCRTCMDAGGRAQTCPRRVVLASALLSQRAVARRPGSAGSCGRSRSPATASRCRTTRLTARVRWAPFSVPL
jgi:hypothetical protein